MKATARPAPNTIRAMGPGVPSTWRTTGAPGTSSTTTGGPTRGKTPLSFGRAWAPAVTASSRHATAASTQAARRERRLRGWLGMRLSFVCFEMGSGGDGADGGVPGPPAQGDAAARRGQDQAERGPGADGGIAPVET